MTAKQATRPRCRICREVISEGNSRRAWHDDCRPARRRQPAPAIDGLIFHPRIMYRSEPGWPDLTLVRRRDRRLIFAELKAEDGKLSARQREVLELLQCLEGVWLRGGGADGIQVSIYVWRPSDMDTIHQVLA